MDAWWRAVSCSARHRQSYRPMPEIRSDRITRGPREHHMRHMPIFPADTRHNTCPETRSKSARFRNKVRDLQSSNPRSRRRLAAQFYIRQCAACDTQISSSSALVVCTSARPDQAIMMLPALTSQSLRFPCSNVARPRAAVQSITCVAAPPVRDIFCIAGFWSMRPLGKGYCPRRDHLLSSL